MHSPNTRAATAHVAPRIAGKIAKLQNCKRAKEQKSKRAKKPLTRATELENVAKSPISKTETEETSSFTT
jgi:hypothetical protein